MTYDVLLWLFVIVSGIAVGAGLYEMRVNVPRWFSAADGTAIRVNAAAIQSDDSGRRFWGFVTTVPLTLLTLASCVAAWSPETARARWWLAAAGVLLVERVATFGYFIPQLLTITRPGSLSAEKAAQTALAWTRLNYLRVALGFAGWLAALKALSLSAV